MRSGWDWARAGTRGGVWGGAWGPGVVPPGKFLKLQMRVREF